MSQFVTTAFVQQYRNNVQFLSQQKGSRLRSMVRNEQQKGKSEFFDQIGAVSAAKKTSRHSDTPRMDTPHSRRRTTLNDYEWADLIDDQDKIRMLIDPTSSYAQSAAWALGRSMDDEIIAAAMGTSYTDEVGGTAVALPTSQRIQSVAAAAADNLNIAALIKAKQIIDASDVDPEMPRYFAYNSSALAALLNTTQVTNSQYNTVRALVEGNVDTFLGFKFVRIERLLQPLAFNFSTANGTYSGGGTAVVPATSKSCFAWAMDGLLLASGMEIKGRIDERSDKSYATQVYAAGSFGATRMEEAKLVEVICSQP